LFVGGTTFSMRAFTLLRFLVTLFPTSHEEDDDVFPYWKVEKYILIDPLYSTTVFLQILFFSCYSAQLSSADLMLLIPIPCRCVETRERETRQRWADEQMEHLMRTKKCVTGGEIEIAYIIEWVCSCLWIWMLFICKLSKRQQRKPVTKSLVSSVVSYPHQRWW